MGFGEKNNPRSNWSKKHNPQAKIDPAVPGMDTGATKKPGILHRTKKVLSTIFGKE
jgi:hypothetical protein